ncbi:phosphoribosylformylglycinamidine synthase I [Candidatus Peribacteria bacterium]|nr:phosphoribosylformylglycinamidine synthase I [Candidatus Peribacteria bacterium]
MKTPRIAIVSFPGNNGEVESMSVIRRVGMEPVFFRWNDDRAILKDVDGYFIPGGFSYEDRGRSGMVAARDPLMEFIASEAEEGKVVIGICNGAQILVESGLIPNGQNLQMCLARNAITTKDGVRGLPLLSEWIWITPSCSKDRCATSNWEGVMQIPIAHGEGRFTTQDKDLMEELKKNDQIAFSYCDAEGKISEDPVVTPNGSMLAIAGVCNPQGNVIALMPHPERAPGNGDAYFASMKSWLMKSRTSKKSMISKKDVDAPVTLPVRSVQNPEIFIETIITNNEERTVEQAARRIAPSLRLKQWKYLCVPEKQVKAVLADLTLFNANKERAFIKQGNDGTEFIGKRTVLIRRDIPDTGAASLGQGTETGIAYGIEGISEQELCSIKLLEVFANPHASVLERLSV